MISSGFHSLGLLCLGVSGETGRQLSAATLFPPLSVFIFCVTFLYFYGGSGGNDVSLKLREDERRDLRHLLLRFRRTGAALFPLKLPSSHRAVRTSRDSGAGGGGWP